MFYSILFLRISFYPPYISDGSLPAFVDTIHAGDATAVIDLVCFRIDTGCFTIAGTQTATIAFGRIDNRLENGKTGDQSQKRSYRADRVAIGSPIPPGKYDQYNESNCGNDKGWEAP